MSGVNDGGPAFPATVQGWNDRLSQGQSGMTLRDWFAGQLVLPPDGISTTWAEAIMGEKAPDWQLDSSLDCVRWWLTAEARARFLAADAMLAERAKAGGDQ